jgi:hypothetical protein
MSDQPAPASRRIENALALVGIAQAALYGTIEALKEAGWQMGPCQTNGGIPWVTLAVFVGCVLPKTLGRATAGKIWEKIPLIGGKQ